MKKARFFGLGVLLLAVLFTACSKKTSVESQDEIRSIVFFIPAMGPVPSGVPEVEAAVNAISEPDIKVKAKLLFVEPGAYAEQFNLMISSGEKLDLIIGRPRGSSSFPNMISQNQLTDITEPIAKYGQDMVKAMNAITPGLLDGTTVNKKILGVTGLYNKVGSHYWCIRNDLLKKHNIDVSNVKSLDDMEVILEKMKIAEPAMSPIVPGEAGGGIVTFPGVYYNNSFASAVDYDNLGDQVNRLAIAFIDDPYTIVNSYSSEAYKTTIRRMRSWYQKGYIYKDSSINAEMGEELVKSGKGFSWVSESEIGVEVNKSAQTGFEIVAIKLRDMAIGTGSLRKFVYGVPSTSKEVEAAVKFMNLLFTDERLVNLLAWGIEGRDYIVKADGTLGYPAGLDANSVPYHTVDFLYGSQYLCKVWEGNPPDLREQAKILNQNVVRSPLLGFSLDTTNIVNEISAITNVISQYRPGLESGTSDPDVELPKFLQDLDAAGARKIIDEAQKQLDAWKASNNL